MNQVQAKESPARSRIARYGTPWLGVLCLLLMACQIGARSLKSQELFAMERGANLRDYGSNRVHAAHTYLGQIALSRHDLPKAGEHLLASAEEAPRTATITTFGPNF